MTDGNRSYAGWEPRVFWAGGNPRGMSAVSPLDAPRATRRPSFRRPIERSTRIAIAVVVVGLLLAFADRVMAEPIEAIVRAKLGPALPAGQGVAKLYLPAELRAIDTDPARVVVELPRELRAGRPSIKLTVRGHRTVWVP